MNRKWKFFKEALLIFIAVILFIIAVSFLLKNIIKVNPQNYGSLIGSILGSVITGFITLAALFITIKNGNENQKKALNVQSTLQAENNLLRVLENQKEAITESMSQLDNLLFTVQILKVSGIEDLLEERKNVINIFSDYRKAMNIIKLNTDIYIDTSKCDGCTDCDIKSYGELSKMKTKLRERFNATEYNCSSMIQELHTALDQCIDIQNLFTQRNAYQKQRFTLEGLIQNYKNQMMMNPNDSETFEKLKQCEAEDAKLKEKIEEIDAQTQTALKDVGERNEKARREANKIQMYDRNELYNSIMKYFDAYSFYIKENKDYVTKNGTLSKNVCKKYKLD